MQGEEEKKGPIPRPVSAGDEASPVEPAMAEDQPLAQDPSEVREEDKRPTPVRKVMEGSDDEEAAGGQSTRGFHDDRSGLDWVVEVTGRSSSGILPLRTVPLLELSFAHADEPSQPLRQVLAYGTDLAHISDQELLTLFGRSEPFREPILEPDSQEQKGRRGKNKRGSRD